MLGNFGAGNSFPVNTLTAAEQTNSTVTYLPDGRFVVVWHSSDPAADGDGIAIRGQIYSAQGGKIGGEFGINSSAAGNQTQPQITALQGGGFAVTWMDGAVQGDARGYQISARIFDAEGSPTGGEFTVGNLAALGVSSPSITALANGGFAIGWYASDFENAGNRIQMFDASGYAVGSEIDPAGDQSFAEQVTLSMLSDGSMVAVWVQPGVGVVGRIIGTDGQAASDILTLSNRPALFFSQPVVTGLADGGFALVWNGGTIEGGALVSNDFVQTFDSAGNASSDTRPVDPLNQSFGSQILATPDGGFYVLAGSYSDGGLAAHRFDANGNGIGERIPVTPLSGNIAALPAFAINQAGEIIVTWTAVDDVFDGDRGGIRAAILSANPATNHTPEITSYDGTAQVQLTLAENTISVATILAADSDGDAPVYTIVAGGDAALFSIDAVTGVLRFNSGPDYEAPRSVGGTNEYLVTVAAHDGRSGDVQTFAITVTNVREGAAINGTSGRDRIDATHTVGEQALPGWDEDTIFGFGGNDEIRGLGGSDYIDGGAGNDQLFGGSGNDELLGGGGKDILRGGQGADILTGGAGRDQFVFDIVRDSPADYVNFDRITDFASGDRIDVSDIDANNSLAGNQRFSFIGENAFSARAGELRYENDGINTFVFGDTNGDGYADFMLRLDGTIALAAWDFSL